MSSEDKSKGRTPQKLRKVRNPTPGRFMSVVERPQPDLGSTERATEQKPPFSTCTTLVTDDDDIVQATTTEHIGAMPQIAESVAAGQKNEAQVCSAQTTSEKGNALVNADNKDLGVQNPPKLNKDAHNAGGYQAGKHADEALSALHPAVGTGGKLTATPVHASDSTADLYVSLWERACASIQEKDPESKHVGNRQCPVTNLSLINL